MKKVISCSFGQTSAFMLRNEMDKEGASFDKNYEVIFCNTGKEHDKTLKFGLDIQKYWGINITYLEYHRVPAAVVPAEIYPEGRIRTNHIKKQEKGEDCHWFKKVKPEDACTSTENDTPFDELLDWMSVLPNVRTRACSSELKFRTMRRYLWQQGVYFYDDYIGIRYDEAHRAIEIEAHAAALSRNTIFPLIKQRITKRQVDEFWDSNSFKLEIPNHYGNCDLCFLKAKWKRIAILRKNPEVGEWWRRWEEKKAHKGQGGCFRLGQSIESLLYEAKQPELGGFEALDEDIPCSCAVGGSKESLDCE